MIKNLNMRCEKRGVGVAYGVCKVKIVILAR